MKNLMNKWMAAIALVSCVACSKTETDIDKAAPMNGNGKVYGYFEPLRKPVDIELLNSAILPK